MEKCNFGNFFHVYLTVWGYFQTKCVDYKLPNYPRDDQHLLDYNAIHRISYDDQRFDLNNFNINQRQVNVKKKRSLKLNLTDKENWSFLLSWLKLTSLRPNWKILFVWVITNCSSVQTKINCKPVEWKRWLTSEIVIWNIPFLHVDDYSICDSTYSLHLVIVCSRGGKAFFGNLYGKSGWDQKLEGKRNNAQWARRVP